MCQVVVYQRLKTMKNYKTITPMKWLLSLTRSVVHRRFHQQGFDYRDLMIWIGLRLWKMVAYEIASCN